MTDTEHDERGLAAAYHRLSTALAGPPDPTPLVRTGIARRRRQRRVLAGAAVLALGGATAGAVALASSGDGPARAADVAGQAAVPSTELSFTRPDGSTHTFTEVSVTCRTGAQGQRLTALSPVAGQGDRLEAPLLMFEAVVGEVEVGRAYDLPHDSASGSSEDLPLILFVADSDTGRTDNEASSAQDGSRGTLRVDALSCDERPVLQLTVDGALGSELGQPPMPVEGVVVER